MDGHEFATQISTKFPRTRLTYMRKKAELSVLFLALKITDGSLRQRIARDVECKFCGEPWEYLAQTASSALLSILTSLLANYIHEKKIKNAQITVLDLYTREVEENVVIYRRAVDRLRDHTPNEKSSQESVRLLVIHHNKLFPLFDTQNVDNVQLLEALEEARSLTTKEIQRRIDEM